MWAERLAQNFCPPGRSTLNAKLARSGHAASVVGLKVVITGGILRDGSLIVDVVIVDLATMAIIRYENYQRSHDLFRVTV